ncbi:MAG: hypothetical protein HDR26_06690 [Lachnospiraceae bacterium]|nr:hypothetical protein [Lachnospiraceae bacterium]
MRGKIRKGLSVWYIILILGTIWGCGQEEREIRGGADGDEETVRGDAVSADGGAVSAGREAVYGQENGRETPGGSGTEIPCEENWYIVEIPEKTEVCYDLDGNGTKERIYYAAPQEPGGTCSVWVDGMEYRDVFAEFTVREDYFGVVDLVREDGCMELALYGGRAESGFSTCFYRYGDRGFVMLGMVPGYIDRASVDSGDVHLDGSGTVYGRFSLRLIQSWEAAGRWILDERGQIQKLQEEFYFPLMTCAEREGKRATVQGSFILYMERDTDGEYVQVPASGAEVDFQATDDREWMLLSVEGGCTGWLHCKDFRLVECERGKYVPSSEVFDNLTFEDGGAGG